MDQVLPTVSHELVHIFAVEDPEGFKVLSDLVFAGLKESKGKTRSYLISEEIKSILEKDSKRFDGKNEETRRAIAEEEIVARACEDRLANSRLMKEFIVEMENKESGLTQKFSNFLGEAIARLKKLFQQIFSTLSRSKEAASLRKLTDKLEAIQSQFDALLERRNTANAVENQANAAETTSEQQKNTSDRGVMNAERETKQSFEEDKYFARQIDKWEELKHGHYVKVGVLQNANPLVLVGLPEGDLRYDVDKIKKNMEGHADYLTKELLKMIPKVISNPVAISEYSKEKNTISVFFDYYVGKSPIMVGVTISKNRAGNEISKIRTFNVRSDVENLITDKNILYLNEDKKRTRKFFQACGIQVPLGGRTFGFIRSISRDEKPVNPQNSPTDKGSMKADRATYMTARELLLQAMSDEELKKSEVYSPLLREYSKRVTELDKKYIQLEAAEHEYVASIDAYDDAKKQESYKNKVDQLTREIYRIERDLTAQEESKELKAIVRREKAATRKYTLEEAKRDTSQRMYDYRQTIERKNTREQIDVKVRRLMKKLRENKRKSHIPDDLKQPLQAFLSVIESKSTNSQSLGNMTFTEATPVERSAQTDFVREARRALQDLREAVYNNSQEPIEKPSEANSGAYYSGLLVIDKHILDEMDTLVKYLDDLNKTEKTYVLNVMDLDSLKQLNKILAHVSKSINSIDKAFAGQGREKISQLASSSLAYMREVADYEKEQAKAKKKEKKQPRKPEKISESKLTVANAKESLKKLISWDQMTPITAFQQFGGGGLAIYKNILQGWGDYAFFAKQILDFAENEETGWKPEEAKKWSEEIYTYELAGQEFDATVAQIMYLYVLNRREQGKLHLNGKGANGGFVIPKLKTNKNDAAKAKDLTAIRSTEAQREAFFEFHSAGKGGDWKAHPL